MAVRLDRSQFGSSRKVNSEQKDQIAGLFDAESDRLSAGKKLLNKRHPAYLQVTALLNRAREVWITSTLPYPEAGMRLIRRSAVEDFVAKMQTIRAQLQAAVSELEAVYQSELIPDARQRLGRLFNASDYPLELRGEFDVQWSFASVDPPEYLRNISPKLYEAEQERVRARFSEAVALAEQAFMEEFAKAVANLTERLTPGPDGKAKVFRDSAIGNLDEFFSRFSALNIGSNPDLDALVEQAKNSIKGVDAGILRTDVSARDEIRAAMQEMTKQLDAMQIDRPKRKIVLAQSEDKPEAA